MKRHDFFYTLILQQTCLYDNRIKYLYSNKTKGLYLIYLHKALTTIPWVRKGTRNSSAIKVLWRKASRKGLSNEARQYDVASHVESCRGNGMLRVGRNCLYSPMDKSIASPSYNWVFPIHDHVAWLSTT